MLESLSNVVTTRANIGLRKMDRLSVCLCPTGASLACQEPPMGGSWQARQAPVGLPFFLSSLLPEASLACQEPPMGGS